MYTTWERPFYSHISLREPSSAQTALCNDAMSLVNEASTVFTSPVWALNGSRTTIKRVAKTSLRRSYILLS